MWVIPSIVVLGMLGGQFFKAQRRYGVPLVAIGAKKEKGWKALIFGWLGFALSIGYGENSTLRRICVSDWMTRIVYGLILSFPFLFFGLWYAPLVLPVAYSVRAGGWKIGSIDFLIEDFIRFSTIGVLVWLC